MKRKKKKKKAESEKLIQRFWQNLLRNITVNEIYTNYIYKIYTFVRLNTCIFLIQVTFNTP